MLAYRSRGARSAVSPFGKRPLTSPLSTLTSSCLPRNISSRAPTESPVGSSRPALSNSPFAASSNFTFAASSKNTDSARMLPPNSSLVLNPSETTLRSSSSPTGPDLNAPALSTPHGLGGVYISLSSQNPKHY